MSGLARGVYAQVRAHDKALDKAQAKARERGQAAAEAAQALQVRVPLLLLPAPAARCS